MAERRGGGWLAIREWVRRQQDEQQHRTMELLEGDDPEAFWRRVAVRDFERGELIFSSGQSDARVYFLVTGQARVYGISPDGRIVTFWYSRAGQFLGLAEAVSSVERSAYADARKRVSVVEIEGEFFHQLLGDRPELVAIALAQLGTRLRQSCDATLALATAPVAIRLAHLLLLLFMEDDHEAANGTVLREAYTHQELAAMIGASRQATSENMVVLRRSGAVGLRYGRLVLLDRDRLLNSACD